MKNKLIAYAESFVSFLLDEDISKRISKIILFGSVARGDFDENSDIDLFIDVDSESKELKEEIFRILNMFESSEINEKWRLKGIKNQLSLRIGQLDKWKVSRSVISNGIILYGKYMQMPEKAKYYVIFKLDFENLKRKDKIKAWRQLYGYKQKGWKKEYTKEGLVKESNGKRIDRGVILVPIEKKNVVEEFLKKHKITYTINEVWSDDL